MIWHSTVCYRHDRNFVKEEQSDDCCSFAILKSRSAPFIVWVIRAKGPRNSSA